MIGDIALVGGEEFRAGCEEMDLEIMKSCGQDPANVLIIPTAAVTGPEKASRDGARHFSALGGITTRLMVLDNDHANMEELAVQVKGSGVIYFTGGSPDHLLASLKGSQLWDSILAERNNGAIIAGSSAGAMVLGGKMRRPRSGGWVDALSAVSGIATLPHHENSDPEQTFLQLEAQVNSGITILGIDARTGCLGQCGSWRVVGSGKVIKYDSSGWTVYASGQNFSVSEK